MKHIREITNFEYVVKYLLNDTTSSGGVEEVEYAYPINTTPRIPCIGEGFEVVGKGPQYTIEKIKSGIDIHVGSDGTIHRHTVIVSSYYRDAKIG